MELKLRDGSLRELNLIEVTERTVKFEGFEVLELARALSASELWVERDAIADLPQGEHYAADLVGKLVIDEKRGRLGYVAAVIETGSNDCLEIKPETGESYLIPMTDEVILSIGTELKVKLLPGLHPDESEEV